MCDYIGWKLNTTWTLWLFFLSFSKLLLDYQLDETPTWTSLSEFSSNINDDQIVLGYDWMMHKMILTFAHTDTEGILLKCSLPVRVSKETERLMSSFEICVAWCSNFVAVVCAVVLFWNSLQCTLLTKVIVFDAGLVLIRISWVWFECAFDLTVFWLH